jgi:hypothetical protein
VQIDLSYNLRIVDEYVEAGKFLDDLPVEASNRRQVAHVALHRVDAGKVPPRSIKMRLASPGDDHRIAECQEPRGKLKTDTGCSGSYCRTFSSQSPNRCPDYWSIFKQASSIRSLSKAQAGESQLKRRSTCVTRRTVSMTRVLTL